MGLSAAGDHNGGYTKATEALALANSVDMGKHAKSAVRQAYHKLLVVLAVSCLEVGRYGTVVEIAEEHHSVVGDNSGVALQILKGEGLYHLERRTEALKVFRGVYWLAAAGFVSPIILHPAAGHKTELEREAGVAASS